MAGTTARAPFDKPTADTIIRSKDGIDFRVRVGIIAEASPIFSVMFDNPFPHPSQMAESPDYMDGKPVVAVEEDSVTLDRLLRLCYPVPDPVFTDLGDVRRVLAAALKYDMEEAVALMKKTLLTFVQSQPLSVWASACILRLEDEAREAAQVLLKDELPIDAPPELQEVSAGTYYRLVKFHRAKGDVNENFRFTEPSPDDVPRTQRTKRPESTIVYKPRPFADIICRSSDGVEFQTHKIILCAASSSAVSSGAASSSAAVSSSGATSGASSSAVSSTASASSTAASTSTATATTSGDVGEVSGVSYTVSDTYTIYGIPVPTDPSSVATRPTSGEPPYWSGLGTEVGALPSGRTFCAPRL